jgi:gas vesicle protein
VAGGGSIEQIVADATHNMQMLVSEKEIEIERLKTTVVSLNSKCAIVDDHLEDVKNTTNRFEESEQQRANLQNHMKQTSKKVQQDNNAHTEYQNQLLDEIDALKALLAK